jgi:DNA processing protein
MLITSAADMVRAMGWESDRQLAQVRQQGIERQLFPDLTSDEQLIVDALSHINDLSLSQLSTQTSLPVAQLSALLFTLEMKGVIRPLAGGMYHLLI